VLDGGERRGSKFLSVSDRENPLREPVFRALWIGVLASNVGTWMQTVGAQWLVVHEPDAATWVSLVQTVTTLPVLLFALPAGTIADALDRRRLLLGVQLGLSVIAAALTALTALGEASPGVLLIFTFLLGCGQALTLPSWQAVIPEVVPHERLPSASALGAVDTNLARSAGPALAGLLVAHFGSAVVFGLNALSFAVFAVALLRWKRPARPPVRRPEHFASALRAGGRYVRYSPVIRRILGRVLLFVLPGSVVWGLLPLVASRELGMGAGGYGTLLAALGLGAIAGALLMPRARTLLSTSRMIAVTGLAHGLALLVTALVPNRFVVTPVLVVAGLAWMMLVSRMNVAMQLNLPNWVRARALAIYQLVFAGGQALGAFAWGAVRRDLRPAADLRAGGRPDAGGHLDGTSLAGPHPRGRGPQRGRLLGRAAPAPAAVPGRGADPGLGHVPGPGGQHRGVRPGDGRSARFAAADRRDPLGAVPGRRRPGRVRRGLPGAHLGGASAPARGPADR
jgi:MFS family permease